MAEAHGLPIRDHRRGVHGGRAQHIGIRQRRVATGRQLGVDDEVGELLQRGGLSVMREMLEVPEADEARRDARDDRGALDRLAPHRQHRAGDAQRARGGNAEPGHRLGAQEFSDRRAQHGAAVAHARIGREPRAFELQLHRPGGRRDLAEQQRAAVAELPGPDAELVAAADARKRLHAGPQGVATEDLEGGVAIRPIAGQAEQPRAGRACRNPVRIRQQLRRERREECLAERTKAVRERDRRFGGRFGPEIEHTHRRSVASRPITRRSWLLCHLAAAPARCPRSDSGCGKSLNGIGANLLYRMA